MREGGDWREEGCAVVVVVVVVVVDDESVRDKVEESISVVVCSGDGSSFVAGFAVVAVDGESMFVAETREWSSLAQRPLPVQIKPWTEAHGKTAHDTIHVI